MYPFIHNVLTLSLVYVPPYIWSLFVFFGVQKYMRRHDSELWHRVEKVFLIGYILLGSLGMRIGKKFLRAADLALDGTSMSTFLVDDVIKDIVTSIAVTLLAVCIGLWYKKSLTVKTLRIFIASYVIGLVGLAVVMILCLWMLRYIF